jgi:hypothetical protein
MNAHGGSGEEEAGFLLERAVEAGHECVKRTLGRSLVRAGGSIPTAGFGETAVRLTHSSWAGYDRISHSNIAESRWRIGIVRIGRRAFSAIVVGDNFRCLQCRTAIAEKALRPVRMIPTLHPLLDAASIFVRDGPSPCRNRVM